jgi:succinyl-diaminopimelate desuccinylase
MSDALEAVVELDAADLFGLTEALCAVPSVHPDEAPLADAVERRLRARAPHLHVVRHRNNVIARTSVGADRRVVLAGHLDTVPPNGNEVPRRDGTVLHGLGSADMKGGLAALLALAETSGRRDPRFDLTLVWYEGEEVADAHNGLRHLFADDPALLAGDLAILLEPTGGWVEAGCQGTLHMEARFHGARAHTARPWMGENAIHKMQPTLDRLTDASERAGTVLVDGLEFREALQIVRIEGGVANNVVPDSAALIVNRRYAPCFSGADAEAQLGALLGDADEVRIVNNSPGASPNLWNPLVAEFIGTLDLAVRPKLGWTDVARFDAHGVPALNFGPGDPTLAHTAGERVERAEIEGVAAALARFAGLE